MREALLQDFISFKMSVTYCDIYTLKIMSTTLDLGCFITTILE